MREVTTYILVPLVIGIALGILNYAALWLTVKNMHLVKHPALLTVVSFVLRMGVILVIFYLVTDGSWERLIVCLLGFIAVRSYFVRRFQPEQKIYNPLKKEEQRHDNQP